MTNKVSVVAIVKDHYATLRDDATGRPMVSDWLVQIGLPVALATGATLMGFRLTDVGQLIAGLAVLTGFTFGLLIFVFQLRLQVPTTGATSARIAKLVDELFANVAYALIIGFVLVLVAVADASVVWESNPLPDGATSAINTIVLGALLLHYVMTMAMCAKRTRQAYAELRSNSDRRSVSV